MNIKEQSELKVGDQVVFIKNEFHANGKLAAPKGRILMVNNRNVYSVGGELRRLSGPQGAVVNGDSRGYAAIVRDPSSVRRATMDDKGYLATKEEWDDHFSGEFRRRLKEACAVTAISTALFIGMLQTHNSFW